MKKKIPVYGSPQWGLHQYQQAKLAKRGHNFEYWNESKHSKMLENGWILYRFSYVWPISDSTSSEHLAKGIVKDLRDKGYFARIIAGYEQNVQRTKMFSIIYKPKKK